MMQYFHAGREYSNGYGMEQRNGRTIFPEYLWLEVPFINDNIPGQNCANRELVLAGKYHVRRRLFGLYGVSLYAKLNRIEDDWAPDTLAVMTATKGVLIGHRFMDHRSRNCLEIIEKLVQFLLSDPLIIENGGRLDQLKMHVNPVFQKFTAFRNKAILYCSTIVEADHEEAGGFTPEIGIRYLLGAAAASYHMVFFHNKTRQDNVLGQMTVASMSEILLKVAGPEIPWEFQLTFVQALVNDRGDQWFFCYCRTDPNNADIFRNCLSMNTM